MKTIKIRFSDLTHMKNLQFLTAAGGILQCFQRESGLFPAPPVSTAVLETEIKNLRLKVTLCVSNDASRNLRNERDILRSSVYEKLVLNGQYVLTIANTEKSYEEKSALVQLAGYPVVSGTRSAIEKIPVQGFVVTASATPGVRKVQVRWKKGKCSAVIIQGTQKSPASSDTVWRELMVAVGNQCELMLESGTWSLRMVGVYYSGNATPTNHITIMIG